MTTFKKVGNYTIYISKVDQHLSLTLSNIDNGQFVRRMFHYYSEEDEQVANELLLQIWRRLENHHAAYPLWMYEMKDIVKGINEELLYDQIVQSIQ